MEIGLHILKRIVCSLCRHFSFLFGLSLVCAGFLRPEVCLFRHFWFYARFLFATSFRRFFLYQSIFRGDTPSHCPLSYLFLLGLIAPLFAWISPLVGLFFGISTVFVVVGRYHRFHPHQSPLPSFFCSTVAVPIDCGSVRCRNLFWRLPPVLRAPLTIPVHAGVSAYHISGECSAGAASSSLLLPNRTISSWRAAATLSGL